MNPCRNDGVTSDPIDEPAVTSDGNHFAVNEDFVEVGLSYDRGRGGHFFIEQAASNFITEQAYRQPFMTRSHLKKGDVLLCIIGTIGESSLVTSDRRATCSRRLTILRPQRIDPAYLAFFCVANLAEGKSSATHAAQYKWDCSLRTWLKSKLLALILASKRSRMGSAGESRCGDESH
jgi:hypothetical protein